MLFEDYALPGFLLEAMVDLGWEAPTAIQSLVLPQALQGADILGSAPTGTGKSAAFLLPIIARLAQRPRKGVQCIILEPTRELAEQVKNDALDLLKLQQESLEAGDGELKEAISCSTVVGGADRKEQRESLATIVTATPGRLQEFLQKGWLDPKTVELLVIDEADRMLDLGFRDDIAAITRKLDSRYQTMLFSATLEGFGVRDFARNVLNNPVEVRATSFSAEDGENGETSETSSTLPQLPETLSARAYYAAYDAQKVKILLHLMKTMQGKSIVFVRTKDNLARLCAVLKRQGMSFASLMGDSSQQERKAALRRFSDGSVPLLIATDVAARGLDIDDVAYVYNYDLPSQAEIYVHRAGRTARAGQKGVVISLVKADEVATLERIERYTQRPIERRAIKDVCESFERIGASSKSEAKHSRAKAGGGFAKKGPKNPKDSAKPHKKVRLRDKKNKGKPDFAAKRAKKAARTASAAPSAPSTEPSAAS
ncbi:MAG: DEAD/DEAH box helicase [Anaerobiospirillum sp.]|nr:DEAD/DEAH box helicase [Anaerobiospirillum sp.]